MTSLNRFLAHVTTAVAMLMASGCLFVSGPTRSPGNISFLWTFNGRTCMQSQDITAIQIQIPGQTLENGGRYNCVNGGTAGIKLLNFQGGSYTYTIAAQNSLGQAVFSATGTVIVDGDVTQNVDLKPTGTAAGTAYVAWTLPVGTSVTCQYLSAVDITVDGATTPTTVTCTQGLYSSSTTTLQGVAFQLAPGTHTIQIDARDSGGTYYYRKLGSMTVNAAETTQQVFSLDWLVGTAALRFTFSNGITTLNCAQAGVQMVQLTFRDSSNVDSQQTVPCMLGNLDGYVPYLYSGNYTVFGSAIGTGGVNYTNFQTNSPQPPTVSVTAGQFPMLQSNSPTVFMSL